MLRFSFSIHGRYVVGQATSTVVVMTAGKMFDLTEVPPPPRFFIIVYVGRICRRFIYGRRRLTNKWLSLMCKIVALGPIYCAITTNPYNIYTRYVYIVYMWYLVYIIMYIRDRAA